MKKHLKADEIKILSITSGGAVAKGDYEQMIVAVQPSAAWVAEPDADVVITHCDTVGGTYTALRTVNVALAADAHVQFQVDLVGAKKFLKLAFERNATPADLLVGDLVLADKRDVNVADTEELPIPAIIHPVLDI